ncbi:methionyl-tRNA formyltransferase [Pseudomonas nitroreducens]|uniref:Methionyl-tRNA formyltransferase n=1 Tax=Pseudomonas nitroreducens TaxID=46680 RepID=A0A5R8ZXZ5_PSENT|nr:formyltransferase family protein [Pseudomonas nitroreducens]TLP70804.1 methionyl-tRNA formyltransferase [Pseudomonas nitroreducens]
MRVVIVGQKWLALQVLRHCVESDQEVAAVICPPGDSLAAEAQRRGLPVIEEARRVTADQVPACDVVLAAHAHAFITAGARGQARLGALGYHPSLLPRHRGRDAIRWALHMREPVTGGSLYWMDDGADTGAVVAQRWCHVRPEDSAADLWRRELGPMGVSLFAETLAALARGEPCTGAAQDEALATWEPAFAPRPLAKDGS